MVLIVSVSVTLGCSSAKGSVCFCSIRYNTANLLMSMSVIIRASGLLCDYSIFSFSFLLNFCICMKNKFPFKSATYSVGFFFSMILGVIVQFSTNNGVQWQFLRELDFSSFLEPQVVTIELPSAAKTPYTVFRWWQPQQG